MYCKHCGKEIADDSLFCKWCGNSVEEPIQSKKCRVCGTSLSENCNSDICANCAVKKDHPIAKTYAEVPKKEFPPFLKAAICLSLAAIAFLMLIAALSNSDTPTSANPVPQSQASSYESSSTTSQEGIPLVDSALMTYEEYEKIEMGMSYDDVVKIVGSYGTELSRTDISGYVTVMVGWTGSGSVGANANITFQNGSVIAKAQMGLE